MRIKARVDANQVAVVKALRGIGASVRPLAQLGDGIPDLLVGRRGINLLLEVKDGTSKPSERKLTPAEQTFANTWAGQVRVVESVREAVDYVLENT